MLFKLSLISMIKNKNVNAIFFLPRSLLLVTKYLLVIIVHRDCLKVGPIPLIEINLKETDQFLQILARNVKGLFHSFGQKRVLCFS